VDGWSVAERTGVFEVMPFHDPETDFHIMKNALCRAPDFDFIKRNFISYRKK